MSSKFKKALAVGAIIFCGFIAEVTINAMTTFVQVRDERLSWVIIAERFQKLIR